MIERTLVLLKPDAIQRGLSGEILLRLERAGLKIIGMKMLKASEDVAKKHYSDKLIPIVGAKTKKDWDAAGVKSDQTIEQIGTTIVASLRKMLMNHALVAVCLEGVSAVENVRKIVGPTGCKDAAPGTIRGDFGHCSLGYASIRKKNIANLIHASGNKEEADFEVKLWFTQEELFTYKSVHEDYTMHMIDW